MRLLTPAAALVSAVAVATASVGMVVHRSGADRPQREFGSLTQTAPAGGSDASPSPLARAATSASPGSDAPDARPSSAPGDRSVAAPTRSSSGVEPPALPSPFGPRSDARPAVIGEAGLFIVDPDASKSRQISDGLIYDMEWLSDQRVAYVRGTTLWLADADGTDKRQAFSGVTDGGFRDIAVSPDRRWIAFVAAQGGSNPRPVWLARADGSDVRKIWNDTFEWTIAWAPDSKRLVFVSGGDEPLGMYIYDLDDGTASPVYEGFAGSPTWTPDGSEIAFSNGGVAAINVATKGYRSLVQSTAGRVWSIICDPTGTRVFYADMNGWRSVPLAGGPSRSAGSSINFFDWTTSGDRAAVVREKRDLAVDGQRTTELVVADADLSDGRSVSVAGPNATILSPRWSPDAERILVRSTSS